MAKNVALLVGGWSVEREVSLNKGKEVETALIEAGYNVNMIDVTRDTASLRKALTPKPDVVFNNLYGKGGEDGVIQGILETLEIPYTHSGVVASAIGMDKHMTKVIVKSIGVRCAKEAMAKKEEIIAKNLMPYPYVVKPNNEGSSIGVQIIFKDEDKKLLAENNWDNNVPLLVEEYIPGREIHVTVLEGKAQGVTEIIVPETFFDYEAKYNDQRTELITPAQVPDDVSKTAMQFAEDVFSELGCSGLARCDFRYDDSKEGTEGVYFLEINTIPGLASGSIALLQPEMNGISFPQLCSKLVESAKCHS